MEPNTITAIGGLAVGVVGAIAGLVAAIYAARASRSQAEGVEDTARTQNGISIFKTQLDAMREGMQFKISTLETRVGDQKLEIADLRADNIRANQRHKECEEKQFATEQRLCSVEDSVVVLEKKSSECEAERIQLRAENEKIRTENKQLWAEFGKRDGK